MQGKVKFFSQSKGYGFIEKEDGGDIFFHISAVGGTSPKSIELGESVEFEVGEGRKGPQAICVVREK